MLTAIFILLCLLAAGTAAVLMLLMRGRSDAQGSVRAEGANKSGFGAGNGSFGASGTGFAVESDADADDDRAEKAFLESLSSLLGYNIDTAREAVRR